MPTKTIKQIADELGVDKQRVYRFIKQNHINEVPHDTHQRNGMKYYDEAAETLIKQGLSAKSISSKEMDFDTVIDMLRTELEAKNRQIEQQAQTITQLTEALAVAQQTAASAMENARTAQALHAGTIQQQLTAQADAVPEKKKIRWPWQR